MCAQTNLPINERNINMLNQSKGIISSHNGRVYALAMAGSRCSRNIVRNLIGDLKKTDE